MREYNVILKKDVDYDSFWNDMESDTDGGKLYIPNRAVEYTNERPSSLRQCWYRLTDEEAEIVRQDDRVLAVEIPPDHRDDIQLILNRTQLGRFEKTPSSTGDFLNYGLVRCNYQSNVFSSSILNPFPYYYSLDGSGVDVVIQDSGLQVDHPEFTDELGSSRVQQINWYNASGITGTQSVNHYRDVDGHGTHVAGIVAGKTYGWAKGAKIYSQKVSGLETASGTDGTGISVSDAFDTIKGWHMAKSGSRPTVVNMSWGYGATYTSVSTLNYRGSFQDAGDIDTAAERENFGLIENIASFSPLTYITNTRIVSVDTDVEEMIDAGIVVVIAAGNRAHKIDISGGTDYNNYFISSGTTFYYHRGSSPYSDSALMVGSIDSVNGLGTVIQTGSNYTEVLSTYTERGPGVDLYAPGTFIMSSCSTTNNKGGQNYYLNSSYRQVNISGTSMAAPQVAGVAALVSQIYKDIPSGSFPSFVKSFILNNATSSLHTTGFDDDYTNFRSAQTTGSVKMLYNPFGKELPVQIGNLSFNGVGLEFR
jgi:subtilisin family serine protease